MLVQGSEDTLPPKDISEPIGDSTKPETPMSTLSGRGTA